MASGAKEPDAEHPLEEDVSSGSRHWRRAMVAALTWWVLATAGTILLAGGVDSSESLGRAAGAMLVPFLLGGGVAGMFARRSDGGWSWLKHLVVTLVIGLVLAVLATIGRMDPPQTAFPEPTTASGSTW